MGVRFVRNTRCISLAISNGKTTLDGWCIDQRYLMALPSGFQTVGNCWILSRQEISVGVGIKKNIFRDQQKTLLGIKKNIKAEERKEGRKEGSSNDPSIPLPTTTPM